MWDKLLEITGGDKDRMKLYIRMYKEGLETSIPTLQRSLGKKDLQAIKIQVHSIKPIFKVMGSENLWERANELELAINSQYDENSILDKVEILIDDMSLSLESVKKRSFG